MVFVVGVGYYGNMMVDGLMVLEWTSDMPGQPDSEKLMWSWIFAVAKLREHAD